MTSAAIVIPFRDRGIDPLRQANLDAVLAWWRDAPWPVTVVDDGRTGDAQFNRSAAYNRGRALAGQVDVIIYTESDMLLDHAQIATAVDMAAEQPGLVVPFTQYRYLSPRDSVRVRAGADAARFRPESVRNDGLSIGAVNVLSQATLDATGGYTERTEGSWYDDTIMHRAFDVCAGPTRWVDGPAFHLYHLPAHKGAHLSDADRAATAHNKALWKLVKAAATPEQVRALL